MKNAANKNVINPIKIAICDDDATQRQFFCEMCRTINKAQNLQMMVKEYEHGKALLFDLEDVQIMSTIDIILLDINMPGIDGIDTARKLRELDYQGEIIFITKSNQHWRNAFDVKAFNYITKDDDLQERFAEVFLEAAYAAMERRGRSLLFSSLNETRQIAVSAISHFKIDHYWVKVYYNNEVFEFTSSMAKIEDLLLGNEDFMRIHRSCLVSIKHIKSVGNKTVVMNNDDELPVSRSNLAALKLRLQKKW